MDDLRSRYPQTGSGDPQLEEIIQGLDAVLRDGKREIQAMFREHRISDRRDRRDEVGRISDRDRRVDAAIRRTEQAIWDVSSSLSRRVWNASLSGSTANASFLTRSLRT